MNPWLRVVWLRIITTFRPRLRVTEVGRKPTRVWPVDLDVVRHINNGVYLSVMDLGRMDLMLRSGVWRKLRRAGVCPVIAAQVITYRRSLQVWQRFTLETRVIGWDETAVIVEQRFVVDGQIEARAVVRARFLRDPGGVADIPEVAALGEVDPDAHPAPGWITEWTRQVALPSTRSPAPSTWPVFDAQVRSTTSGTNR